MTTRRKILAGLGLAPFAALPAVATPPDRVAAAVAELQAALAERHSGTWDVHQNFAAGLVALTRLSS